MGNLVGLYEIVGRGVVGTKDTEGMLLGKAVGIEEGSNDGIILMVGETEG